MYIQASDLVGFIPDNTDSNITNAAINGVCSYIDHYCGTTFANSTPSDLYFDGNGTDELIIYPVQSVSAVKFLDVQGNVYATLNAGDYNLYPLNETIKTTIKLSSVAFSNFPHHKKAVMVTAVTGAASVPSDIKLIAIQLAAKVIMNALRGGDVIRETLGAYTIQYKEINDATETLGVKETLNQYRVMTLE